MLYKIPDEYYYRIHHVRPRFKNDVENVLIFMATEIQKLDEMSKVDFRDAVNSVVRMYPGNATKTQKTINNWRTEISALFGFIQQGSTVRSYRPGLRAQELADKQDLIEAFKIFLYLFQYPGGHIKPHEVAKYIEQGINFKPASYILGLLEYAERVEGTRIGINKAELTHCIFNDLRCTRDNEDFASVWKRIKLNRQLQVEYDWTGDVIRYAGDIIDYMVIANLLVNHGNGYYYINWLERKAVYAFIQSKEWFDGYDYMIRTKTPDITSIKRSGIAWYDYVNQPITKESFETDILAFISNNEDEYQAMKKTSLAILKEKLKDGKLATKDIGDWGENLVHGHECERVKRGGRKDLIHLIQVIPNKYSVGYDIQSVELNELKRYIEVKTTISSKPIDFNKFHLTTNEWNAAGTLKDRYFVYRLYLSKTERKLFQIQDPVKLYKNDKLRMTPRNGADIIFNPEECGTYEELLSWTD